MGPTCIFSYINKCLIFFILFYFIIVYRVRYYILLYLNIGYVSKNYDIRKLKIYEWNILIKVVLCPLLFIKLQLEIATLLIQSYSKLRE